MTDNPSLRQAEIQAREQAATKGPWTADNAQEGIVGPGAWGIVAGYRIIVEHDFIGRSNAEFCASARQDIPWLLQRLAQVEQVSLPMVAAGMMTVLKEECERQHARAEIAESALAAARQEMANDSPILAFQAWCERRATIRGPMTQDQYFLAQEAFYAAHPGQGPTSALMSDDLAAARLRASEVAASDSHGEGDCLAPLVPLPDAATKVTLECPCCGDDGAESDANGLFYDGQSLICGCPGMVSVDEEPGEVWINNLYAQCPKCDPSGLRASEDGTRTSK